MLFVSNKNKEPFYSPKSIDDLIGQKHLFHEYGLLKRMVELKKPYSLLVTGEPGIGKTTLCNLLIEEMNLPSYKFNSASDSLAELKEFIDKSRQFDKCVIIIDEIHRLHRDKQDILIKGLDAKLFNLFGITTENPYFSINPAIRSRVHTIRLTNPTSTELFEGYKKIIKNKNITNINDDILYKISHIVSGDLRKGINIIELLNTYYKNIEITDDILKNVIDNNLSLSSYGDKFHDLKSALQKSIRGSDPDAAVYYLAQLIATKDLTTISRRLIACAYEDIGLANPELCSRVYIATQAAKEVGFPEANQILSSIVIEMALSEKSSSAYESISNALIDVFGGEAHDVPWHIKKNAFDTSNPLYNFQKYKNPHNYKNHWVDQDYLPREVRNKKYYDQQDHNYNEKLMNDYWLKWRKEK
ncbi:AAA family ATPase [Mycoplasma bradburyae]|uniref:AAA family ATPase n=1 Tax=Mycoplasma bradburyae TaxID=2963128 RepID=A0AAW6HMP5_9MOLU|nr:AAA family ATPase [Mycoplasma bradburyae]MDC4183122.1 AAA family ATPase [Mycoplasma bradburyae]UTS70643.1 AAA family ATPase [Mycoplasma bradburyae]